MPLHLGDPGLHAPRPRTRIGYLGYAAGYAYPLLPFLRRRLGTLPYPPGDLHLAGAGFLRPPRQHLGRVRLPAGLGVAGTHRQFLPHRMQLVTGRRTAVLPLELGDDRREFIGDAYPPGGERVPHILR